MNMRISSVHISRVTLAHLAKLFAHINTALYITTLCLNGTLSSIDLMDVIMGDIPIHNLPTLTVFERDTPKC